MVKYENSEPRYVGCVYNLGEHNYYNDSDFYAEYLDFENGMLGYVEYDTTRFGGGGYATKDLSFEKLNEWWSSKAKSVRIEIIKEDLLRWANQVSRGKRVVVSRGRKVPHGIEGEVFWLKEVNYDPYNRPWGKETRIGIKDDSGNVYWTYAKNVDVIAPEQFVTEELILAKLKSFYDSLFDIAANLRKNEDKESLRKEYYQF